MRRLVLLLLAANGCSAYAEGGTVALLPGGSAAVHDAGVSPARAAAPAEPAPALPPASPQLRIAARPDAAFTAPVQPAPPPVEAESGALRVARSERFDAYLTDALGRALYMYARDTPDAEQSACLGDCARQWPPFDAADGSVSAQLAAVDVSRFHRADGAFQTAYRGHPLYYRASELGSREVTGDGAELRWFVARDYLSFLAAATSFTPLGGSAGDGLYLTDGSGRPLYVCLDDLPLTASRPARSSCDTPCTLQRPVFASAQTARSTRLPSVLNGTDLNELVRPDGQHQLTYRGWPLYYFSGDQSPGAPAGHNQAAWRVIDPLAFAREPQPGLPEP